MTSTARETRRSQRARLLDSYLASNQRPYIHLVDGGLTDNLGLRAIMDEVVFAGGIRQAIERQRLGDTDHILFVVVNAQTGLNSTWDKLEAGPSASQVVDAATTVQINRYNFETVELLRSSFEQWTRELRNVRCAPSAEKSTTSSRDCSEVKLHLVEVGFDGVADLEQRKQLRTLPTSFNLPQPAVDQLRSTARKLLRDSPEFQRFLRAAGTP